MANAGRQRGLAGLILLIDAAGYFARSLVVSALGERHHGRPRVAVGVDRIGALAAFLNRVTTRTPYLWLSLELQDGERSRADQPLRQRVFGAVLRNARALVIQDEARFRAAVALYDASPQETVFLPNGPAGRVSARSAASGTFFRKRFGPELDRYEHVILHAGGINDDFFSLEIAESFSALSQCALVFHERTRRDEDEPFIRELRSRNHRNLFLSLEPVPYEEIDKPYEAASIGLAFYRPLNDDLSEIAMASGKLAFYLRHGKPVVMNDLDSFRRLLRDYRFGVLIADPTDATEVAAAVERILEDYDSYALEARRCFAERFDMETTSKPVLDLLDSLSGSRRSATGSTSKLATEGAHP